MHSSKLTDLCTANTWPYLLPTLFIQRFEILQNRREHPLFGSLLLYREAPYGDGYRWSCVMPKLIEQNIYKKQHQD